MKILSVLYFPFPETTPALVETQTGGTHGGGAVIPELGQVILKKFRAIEQQAAKALEHNFQELSSYS
ncbi:hypothetical protein F973_00670 [Acinetobacter sp. CIP 102129]|nr:hypothetical protein [Acinetobacter sp. CIP 102129]ENU87096.1 hypothetical protein F973_00670 [Acinetobacter sp. CIP 102129]